MPLPLLPPKSLACLPFQPPIVYPFRFPPRSLWSSTRRCRCLIRTPISPQPPCSPPSTACCTSFSRRRAGQTGTCASKARAAGRLPQCALVLVFVLVRRGWAAWVGKQRGLVAAAADSLECITLQRPRGAAVLQHSVLCCAALQALCSSRSRASRPIGSPSCYRWVGGLLGRAAEGVARQLCACVVVRVSARSARPPPRSTRLHCLPSPLPAFFAPPPPPPPPPHTHTHTHTPTHPPHHPPTHPPPPTHTTPTPPTPHTHTPGALAQPA